MENKNDFENYRELSKPFASTRKANEATKKFFELVSNARRECGIMDVHIVVMTNVKEEDSEGRGMSYAHFGNSLEGEFMLAWGLSEVRAANKRAIAHILATKVSAG